MHKDKLEEVLGVELRFEAIHPQLLNNDHLHYQRFRIEKRVLELVAKLKHSQDQDHSAIAAQRPDGSYWVINGQHHTEAVVRLEWDLCEFMIFDSTGWEHEKEIFNNFQHWQLNK